MYENSEETEKKLSFRSTNLLSQAKLCLYSLYPKNEIRFYVQILEFEFTQFTTWYYHWWWCIWFITCFSLLNAPIWSFPHDVYSENLLWYPWNKVSWLKMELLMDFESHFRVLKSPFFIYNVVFANVGVWCSHDLFFHNNPYLQFHFTTSVYHHPSLPPSVWVVGFSKFDLI